jgi:hypothetical protein
MKSSVKWRKVSLPVDSISKKALLVGDNPFHSISHLSQDRTRARDESVTKPEHAADLILLSLDNGANGFMFSVSDATLSILRIIRERGEMERLSLYPIVPYAYEYVQLATQVGGIPGLAKRFARQIVTSGNFTAVADGFKGVMRADPVSLMKAYLTYEVSRIKSSAGKKANVASLVLHEIVTDLALALNLNWFFKAYVDFVPKMGALPGFNTCNFTYLIDRFNEWNIDPLKTVIASPFNKAGFQMNPSRTACEETLRKTSGPVLIAISVMAAGYLRPDEAVEYIAALPNVKGVAAGVSKEKHAQETFKLLDEKLNGGSRSAINY